MARYETEADWHIANPEPEMLFHHCPHCTERVVQSRVCDACDQVTACDECGETLHSETRRGAPTCPNGCAS